MKVRVYRNLRSKCWSIMENGRVAAHARQLTLQNARFIVREGGRQRVIRDKRKNVHAFVEGDLVKVATDLESLVQLGYNPYNGPTFVVKGDNQPIYNSGLVVFTVDGSIFGEVL